MIAFATAISDRASYERIALPGIRRAAEPDSPVLVREGWDSIQRPYNDLLEEAAGLADLEALVLLHQDLELTDDSLPRLVRSVLADRRVGAVGAFGARDLPLHRWTEATDLRGTAALPDARVRFSDGPDEVDVVDGSLLVLAPWVVRGLRFDEALAADFHGYDIDLCLRVKAVGGSVVCADIPHVHHMARRDDHDAVRRAGLRLAASWDPALRPRAWAPAFQR